MQRLGFPSVNGLALVFTLAAFAPISHACDIIILQYSIDFARTKLKRAANETDLEWAKDYARKAKRALDDSAMAAMGCGCGKAYSEFDIAASSARRARDADDANEFVDSLNRSIRSFNSASKALLTCPQNR